MRKSANITVMEKAVRKAGRSLSRDFNEVEHLLVSVKGPGDFVSQADLNAEKILKEDLMFARPEYGFLCEESGDVSFGPARDGSVYRWIIDPLDGTTNFLHGIPHFCISVGLEKDGEIIAGMILDVVKDELFWAEKGQGAYLNSRRLRTTGRKMLPDALVFIGLNYPDKMASADSEKLLSQRCILRDSGCAALNLSYVAAGRADGYLQRKLGGWDVAAGVLLVREAGGFVTQANGEPAEMVQNTSVLAGNESIHRELLALLRDDTV